MRDVDPVDDGFLTPDCIQTVFLIELPHQGVEIRRTRVLERVGPQLKLRVERLPEEGIQKLIHIQKAKLLDPLLSQHIRPVAVGVNEEERRLIVVQIGREGHVGLAVAHREIGEGIAPHEIIGLPDFAPEAPRHGLERTVKLRVRDIALQELGLLFAVHEAGIGRHDPALHALDKGPAFLHAVVAVKADVEHHFRIAAIAQLLRLRLSHGHEPEIEIAEDRIVFFVIGVHQIVVIPLAPHVIHHVVQRDLHPVYADHGLCHRVAVLHEKGVFLLCQRREGFGELLLGILAVLRHEAGAEVLPLQPLPVGGGAAGEVHILHNIADLRQGREARRVFRRPVFVREIPAAPDIRNAGHGVHAVVAGEELIEHGDRPAVAAAVAHGPDRLLRNAAKGRGVGPFIGHVVKAQHLVGPIGPEPAVRQGRPAEEHQRKHQGKQGRQFLFHLRLPFFLFTLTISCSRSNKKGQVVNSEFLSQSLASTAWFRYNSFKRHTDFRGFL